MGDLEKKEDLVLMSFYCNAQTIRLTCLPLTRLLTVNSHFSAYFNTFSLVGLVVQYCVGVNVLKDQRSDRNDMHSFTRTPLAPGRANGK